MMPQEAVEKKKVTKNHPIRLKVNQDGEFTYDPSFVRAKRGETITFSNPDKHAFAVMFKDRSPGDRLSLSDKHPTLKIDDDAPYAVYHYAAAIFDTIQVHLDSGCGDVGVEN